jgi:hypothetical protein
MHGSELESFLGMIRDFAAKQNDLIRQMLPKLPPGTDELSLLRAAPSQVFAMGQDWDVSAHGIGVSFTGSLSGEVIDVHCGVFDDPPPVDAWRLEQYIESSLLDSRLGPRFPQDSKTIQSMLAALAEVGTLIETPEGSDCYLLADNVH